MGGGISHVGAILFNYYTEEEEVADLVHKGDISSLGKKLYPDTFKPHTFDDPQPDVTVCYHRDRGESWNLTHYDTCHSISQFLRDGGIQYFYLYDVSDGFWKVYVGTQFVPLGDIL